MSSRISRAAALVTAAALLTTPALVTAPASAATDPRISFRDLGVPEQEQFPGRTATVTVTLPVPTGLTPTALRGTLQVPAAYSRGVMEVVQDNRVLGRATVESGQNRGDIPVTLPLDGIDVTGDGATVQLRTTLDPVDETWCHDPLDTVTSVLRDASVSYDGTTRPPATLAEALPPVLGSLTVTVPAQPDASVTAAALETTTAVAAMYRSQAPEIRVVERDRAGATAAGATAADGTAADGTGVQDAALTRRIDIPGDNGHGITLEHPGTPEATVVLHGTGEDLLDQARLLTSGDPDTGLTGLLDSTDAHARDIPVELSPRAETLADLGATALTATGTGSAQVVLDIGQGELGRLAGSVKLHLSGSVSPLPADAPGELTVAVNGTVVDRTTTTGDSTLAAGVLDREVDIPADLLTRYNSVTLTFSGSGVQGCGTTAPLTLRVDPETTVTSTDAEDPTRLTHGFQALPAALLPEVDVILTDGDATDVDRAARILSGFQSTTGARVRPVPVAPQDAGSTRDSGRPLLVVDADGDGGDLTTGEALPVTFTDGVLTADGLQAETSTDLGVLQTRWDHDRHRMSVIAGSTGSPELLDQLIDDLDRATDTGRGTGWADLRGTAVVSQDDGGVHEIGVPDDRPAPAADQADSSTRSGNATLVAVVAAVVVAALLVAVGVAVRRRRP